MTDNGLIDFYMVVQVNLITLKQYCIWGSNPTNSKTTNQLFHM